MKPIIYFAPKPNYSKLAQILIERTKQVEAEKAARGLLKKAGKPCK